MQYTLGDARKLLSSSSHAYGVGDIRVAINKAIQALASMSSWECLRKVLRFSTVGPEFSLPQGCAGLVRVCVNGKPVSLRGQDFKFIHSGPGDLTRPPVGFERIDPANVIDLGWSPLMVTPKKPFRVFAFTENVSEPPVYVRGITTTGEIQRIAVTPYKTSINPSAGEHTIESAAANEATFIQITEITIDPNATDYVSLYADDGQRFLIGHYHPAIRVPEFRHYQIPGVRVDTPLELLAEVRIDPLPLIRETDIIPFKSLEPIEWMIRYDWNMKSGEVDAATQYQAQAAQWLKGQEVVEQTVQKPIIVNVLYEGSLGQMSREAENI